MTGQGQQICLWWFDTKRLISGGQKFSGRLSTVGYLSTQLATMTDYRGRPLSGDIWKRQVTRPKHLLPKSSQEYQVRRYMTSNYPRQRYLSRLRAELVTTKDHGG